MGMVNWSPRWNCGTLGWDTPLRRPIRWDLPTKGWFIRVIEGYDIWTSINWAKQWQWKLGKLLLLWWPVAHTLPVLCPVDTRKKVGAVTGFIYPVDMNALKARGKQNTSAPVPDKGVLVREPAMCDECKRECRMGGQVVDSAGYYTYYDKKLCKLCIKGVL